MLVDFEICSFCPTLDHTLPAMANTDDIKTQVVVCSAAVAPCPPPSQSQPSDEIVRALAAFLHKDQADYVKIREDDKYYYVKIGPSKAVDQVYQPLYNRVQAIKDKYHTSIHTLLTHLKANQVPNTSKVAISRSKRTTNATTSCISNDTAFSSSRGKTRFRGTTSKGQTTDDSIGPDAIEGEIIKLQSFGLDLVTELSIDPNTTAESASTSKPVAITIAKSKKKEKLKAIVEHSVPVGTLPPAPTSAMTKAEARNAERRLKLAQMQLEQDKANEAKKEAAANATTSKGTGAKALKATKSAKNQLKKGVGKKQIQPKPVQVELEPTVAQHTENDVTAFVMSPIAKLSGINGKINETFTAGPGPNHFTTPKADVSVTVGNSTFICASGPSSGDGALAMASAPPSTTPNKANSTFNLSKALQSKLNSTNNYEMTPPPRELSHNYDISQYIDSEDEEKKAEHDAAARGKPVPKWCQGKSFHNKVHAQFSMPPEQLAEWTRRLFPKPVLPVPLEDMGLTVRERYAQRSSSVNWKTVQKIESMAKKDEAELQKE